MLDIGANKRHDPSMSDTGKSMLTDAQRDQMIRHLVAQNAELRAENAALREETAQLRAENAKLRAENAALKERIAKLEATVRELLERLNLDSSNSHKPPSSDKPKRSLKPKSDDDKKKKRRKRSSSRKGNSSARKLLPPEMVDHLHDLKPQSCRHCDHALMGEDVEPQRHQVTELPPIKPVVTEYRLHALRCSCCGKNTRAQLPEDVSWSHFGPRLKAFIILLIGVYRLSRRQTQMLLDEFNVEVSLGSIHNIEQQASKGLAKPVAEVAEAVREMPVANVDETSWLEQGKKRWLWVVTTALATLFVIRDSRGKTVAQELLGEDFLGIVISDRYASYHWVDEARHQYCWAHLKRDFKGMVDSRNVATQAVGKELLMHLKNLFKWWRKVKEGRLTRDFFRGYIKNTLAPQIEALLEEGSRCGHTSKYDGMCRKILRHKECLWTFAWFEGVEPTNNEAERALRHAVIWRRTSFGSGGENGSGHRFVERILTVIATLKQHGRGVQKYLEHLFKSMTRGQPAPSLLPSHAHV